MTNIKLHVLLIFVFIQVNFFAQSISGIIEYESKISDKKVTSYLSSKRDKLKKKMNVDTFDKVYLSSKGVKSKLTFLNDAAIFKVEEKLNLEHIDIAERFIFGWSGGSNIFYSNSKTKKSKEKNCKTLGDCFIISSNFKEWQLTQETKKIAGYLCYKAIRIIKSRKGSFDIIAWYTPSIPVNFGPKGECGLPGLILELEEPSIIFRAKLITLNPKKEIKVNKLSNGIEISDKEYKKKVKKIADGIFGKRN
jgi:GLPGLI family protein